MTAVPAAAITAARHAVHAEFDTVTSSGGQQRYLDAIADTAVVAAAPHLAAGQPEITDRWRTGRHLGRTLYAQHGPDPSDDDQLIGLMETTQLAQHAAWLHNTAAARIHELEQALADILGRFPSTVDPKPERIGQVHVRRWRAILDGQEPK